ncbi:T9SS type A sorting domain-containing protein [Carboxylicivirga marina]|uniref:T9SS type A sorting domain-containing protein n=1 Tax=Carboxylicivirga marina TaxID=2800988 RepID=UPI002598F35D|nr:T9SS type A sorting domain-containing protein [uncultured Carboxylicivirga sp.]
MSKIIAIILFFALAFNGSSQISHGGMPKNSGQQPEAIQLQLLQKPMAALHEEIVEGKFPLRFAEPIYTALSPQNSGEWQQQGDIYIWRLALKSEGAKSLNVIFDRFELKHEDKLYAYNPEKSHVLGSFTNENNNPSKLFAIAPILGDEMILELQTLSPPHSEHELLISAVNHDYLGVVDYIKRGSDFGDSGDCNIDAVCGTLNSKEVNRSVCKIIVDGSMLCSGTLLNNTSENGKPYFLTAAHCFDGLNTDEISSGTLNAQNIIFYFNFASPTCDESTFGVADQTISGANIKAFVKNMDFTLLEMSKMPPESYNPYWAGWSRDEVISDKAFGVHHPQGDVKKVSVSASAPLAATYTFFGRFIEDVHWQVEEWESGVTEGGSSGSGLFTQDQYLIGSLSGGEAYCGNPYNDYYSRLNQAWDLNSEDEKQLANWLDNGGTNANKLDGIDYYENKEIVTHLEAGYESAIKYSNEFIGSWSGHNSNGYEAYAECFNEFAHAKIAGVYVSPAKVENSNENQTFNIKIWSEQDSKPDIELASINNISLENMSTAKQLFTFDEPLEVSGTVFAGIELNYVPSPIDTFAVYQIKPANGLLAKNSAFVNDNGSWKAYNTMHPSGDNGAYLIDLLVYKDYVPTDTGEVDKDQYRVTILNNPIKNGVIEFTSNVKDLYLVEIYGLNGLKVKEYQIQNSMRDSFLTQGIQAGIYLLKFKSESTSIVRKVLILN